jgi:predicted heme/steroid binding protein
MSSDRFPWLRFMIKLDRLAAWMLLIVMLLFAVSGYAMTKGLFDPGLARKLHMAWLGGIGLVAFVVHTSWGIHLAFKRWGWWNRFTRIFLIAIYVALASFFIYVDQLEGSRPSQKTEPIGQATLTATSETTADNTEQKVFGTKELLSFDGKNGNAAYVAVDGVVYDFSSVFKGGLHAGYEAGRDQSEAFHSRHSAEILTKFKIMGALSAQ